VLKHFNWELSDHPPHSPDLVQSDCNQFTYMKNWLKQQCGVDGRCQNVTELTSSNFLDTDIQELVPRYKCLDSGGDYIEN
jgi:hypothetical protein